MVHVAQALFATILLGACAPAPHPALDEIGAELGRAGDHLATAAAEVDRLQFPVPVPGSPSCSRPGCR